MYGWNCHGGTDKMTKPLQSSYYMGMKIAAVSCVWKIGVRLNFAYLSACHTAEGREAALHPDLDRLYLQ